MENENTNVVADTANQEQASQPEAKSYSEAEVQALLQQETDRRVTSALKKQQQQYELKVAEAEKLRGMDETQKREYEFEQRIKELELKEKEFTITQNKLEASKVMASRGLPVAFVDYIVADDAETMMSNINAFETAFKSAVADAVSAKLASPTPKAGNVLQTGMTKEQFRKLSTAQQSELYRTNPELYKQMVQG